MFFASNSVPTPEIVWWALLPVIVLAVSGVLLLTISSLLKKEISWLAPGISLTAGIFVLLSSIPMWNRIQNDGPISFLNNSVGTDGSTIFLTSLIAIALISTSILARPYLSREGIPDLEFYVLLLLSAAGGVVMAGANDLIVLFLGIEILSIAVYVLVALHLRKIESQEGAIKYFLLGAFSSAFLLYGIALVYGATGSTNVAVIGEIISSGEGSQNLLSAAIALLTIGFAFKVSAIPFHMWTPDVYEGAPAPVTAWMSAAVKAAGFVAFLRVLMVGFDSMYPLWYPILWWLAAITMVGANLIALVQTNIKRMLAYSSIAHAGYLLVAIAAANETASAGMLFYLLVYTLMNMGAFAIVMSVSHHSETRLYIDNYVGFGWAQPLLGIFLTIFLLSLAGFPGTGGFMGKIYLLLGAAESDLWALSVILVLTTVLSYWYYLRVAWVMWMKNPEVEGQHDRITVPLPMRFALLVSVGLILYVGILPSGTLEFARASIEGLGTFGGGLLGQGP